jgi:hypothetical protein
VTVGGSARTVLNDLPSIQVDLDGPQQNRRGDRR